MKFSEFDKGTYICAKFTEDTLDRIQEVQKKLGLLNPVKREDLHSTICFSRVYVPFIASNENEFVSKTGHLEIFETNDGPALVLCLDSDYLKHRHELSNILGATYDYPDYKPHITLSYNLGSQYIDLERNNPIEIEIISSKEVVEDLDLDWTKDKV